MSVTGNQIADVKYVLQDYIPGRPEDHVAVAALWNRYVRWWDSTDQYRRIAWKNEETPPAGMVPSGEKMNANQFGRAVRALYPQVKRRKVDHGKEGAEYVYAGMIHRHDDPLTKAEHARQSRIMDLEEKAENWLPDYVGQENPYVVELRKLRKQDDDRRNPNHYSRLGYSRGERGE